MGVEEIDWLEAFAADLGVKVDAAGSEAAVLEDRPHDLRGQVDIRRKLVGVPAHERVAGVGVDRAEEALQTGILELVLHLVAGERGVVGLDVHLHVLLQAVGPEEVDARGRVKVVLVLHRLAGLGLEVELAREADLPRVFHRHVHEPGEMVELPLHVGVPEALVTFAAAPERVAGAAETMCDLHRLLHLGRRVGEDLGVGAGGRSVHVAGIREQVGRAPEQLLAGPLLVREQPVGDGVEVCVALGERRPLGRHVAVVKAVEVAAELLEELEGHVHSRQRRLERIAVLLPGADHRAGAEGVEARAAESVPVGDSEAKVVAHRLALHERVGVVVAEGQHVLRLRTLVADLSDTCERFCHRRGLLGGNDDPEVPGASPTP